MIIAMALFHVCALFSVQLVALTAAIFLFIYIKKQDLSKWFSFAAAAIIGLVLLTMAACFIGAVCMSCCHGGGCGPNRMMHGGECPEMGMGMHKRIMIMHGEGGGGCQEGMECHKGMMGMGCEGMECHKGMECEGMECHKGMMGCSEMSCEGNKECQMECCKGKDGHCDMMGGKGMEMKKDTVGAKKGGKK